MMSEKEVRYQSPTFAWKYRTIVKQSSILMGVDFETRNGQ